MAATMPAGVVSAAATEMVLLNCVPVGAAILAAPLLTDVKVSVPLLLAPEAYPDAKVPEKVP